MIRYSLKCATGHGFDSWFPSGTAYDTLRDAGRLECPVCGNRSIEKALMSPRVAASRDDPQASQPVPEPHETTVNALSTPPSGELAKAIGELRARIERDTEYVGDKFAAEARAIHAGDAPERAIRGQADTV